MCSQQDKNLRCYGYNIKNNEFTGPEIIGNNECGCEPIQIRVEYFPETNEFLMGCKSPEIDDNKYSIA